jgi:hypothetical protein
MVILKRLKRRLDHMLGRSDLTRQQQEKINQMEEDYKRIFDLAFDNKKSNEDGRKPGKD